MSAVYNETVPHDLPQLVGYVVIAIILAAATHRGTRFITRDKFPLIFEPRERFVRRWGVYSDPPDDAADDDDSWKRTSIAGQPTNLVMRSLAYLWECDWCTSVWVGGALAYGLYRWFDVVIWIALVLAASSFTGIVSGYERE